MVYSRKFEHSVDDLLKEGKRIISENNDSKYLFRVAMVNLVLSGIKCSDLSVYCGVDERTISGWVSKADRQGFESLRAVKQNGRPPKLKNDVKEKIKFVISNDPSEYGYTNWDGPSLSDYIMKEYGIEYSVRACQKLFHELGFSLIRPQTYPSLDEPDEQARESFKRALNRISNDPERIVVFQDEVHFSIQSTITREWAPKGSEPKVKSYPGRKNASYSGFVLPSTGELWTDSPDWFNYSTTIESIRSFIAARPPGGPRKYCIVLDNAPWHKKALRLIRENANGEYDDIVRQAEFLSLPPYSPDLNPIEQVWRVTRKKKTHNRFFRNIDILKETLESFFGSLSKPNDLLKNLCSFRWIRESPQAE
ncbi:MAG: IS630 family transposase [archaeon]|nr:IS630 family transposase [archaeon]